MDFLIGIDIGTTNTKAVAFSLEGLVIGQSSRPTPVQSLGNRQAQYDPQKLWEAVLGALEDVQAQLENAHALGICVASIGESGVPLDCTGTPCFPSIAWFDERTLPQTAWWEDKMGKREVFQNTGLSLSHIFSLNKLVWLRSHEPKAFARTRRWLCISDYIAYCLCGEQAMGYSLASRTMAFNPLTARWSTNMLAAANISEQLWPQPLQEGSLLGKVLPKIANSLPMLYETPVFVGGHDHVVASLAVGAIEPGIMIDSTGTTETEMVALKSLDKALSGGNTSFCLGRHVVKDRYYAIAGILGAGSMIQWMAKLLYGSAISREDSIDMLTRAAQNSPIGSKGLWILPHMAGKGAPNRDEESKAIITGLDLDHSNQDIARATIEGLAYELAYLWDALEDFTGQHSLRTISVGGGSQNQFWMQIKADITNHPFDVAAEPEAVAKGAAMLAGIGLGLWPSAQSAIEAWPCHSNCIQPDLKSAEEYAKFRSLLQGIRPIAHALEQGTKLLGRQTLVG